jgi:hypothetical protein
MIADLKFSVLYHCVELMWYPNGVYFIVSIKKTPLHNRNNPIKDPITKMEEAHAFEQCSAVGGLKICNMDPLSTILSD